MGGMRLRLLLLLVVGVLAGCGGGDDNGDGGDGDGGTSAGARVFSEAGCGGCHTFSPAGSNGTTAPNLDEADVTFEQAVEQVTNGGGGMPAFEGDLSEQEIEDVARFVAGEEGSAAGGGGGSVVGPFVLTARD
jgi:mono/diheme cytochrome c family protein